jgi:hypothetical protein
VGEFVVRPSSQGLDKLTLTRKVCGLSASLSHFHSVSLSSSLSLYTSFA